MNKLKKNAIFDKSNADPVEVIVAMCLITPIIGTFVETALKIHHRHMNHTKKKHKITICNNKEIGN